jgi:hypothetical protein
MVGENNVVGRRLEPLGQPPKQKCRRDPSGKYGRNQKTSA